MERDDVDNYVRKLIDNFNSHAHVERDKMAEYKQHFYVISTHTLTWSVTFTSSYPSVMIRISTHTLTWSVT